MGILVQSPSQRAFCARLKVHVSVETTETSPSFRPFQSRSWSFFFLICGQQAKRWPSGPSNAESSSTRYWAQVSA